MENKRDYYDVLGVSKDATQDEIKKSFRKLSMLYHPDRQVGKTDQQKKEAEEKFKEASEAYDVLQDPQKRSNYDQFGFEGNHASGGGMDMGEFMRRHADMFTHFFHDDDDFSPFGFGGRQRRNSPPDVNQPDDGRDVRIKAKISFKEAIFGCKKEFDIQLSDVCNKCHGTGVKDGSKVKECQHCHGSGTMMKKISQGFMTQIMSQPCPYCQGEGYVFDVCKECHGQKRTPAKKHISVNIPAGIENGQKLRVNGKGEVGTCGGRNGDLYIIVEVEESNVFQRQGLDLKIKQPISPIDASLGGKVDVLTPYGYCSMKVPSGTKSGQILRLVGKGIKSSAGIGNLLVEVSIEPFQNLTEKQIEILNSLKLTLNEDNLLLAKQMKKDSDQFLKK